MRTSSCSSVRMVATTFLFTLVSACVRMKTADGASLPPSSFQVSGADSSSQVLADPTSTLESSDAAPNRILRREPQAETFPTLLATEDLDFASHREAFRRLSAPNRALPTSEPTSTKTTERPRITERAKIFASKTFEDEAEPSTTTTVEPTTVEYTIEGDDICKTCPSLWMESSRPMTDQCSNAESLSSFFAMNIDARNAESVQKSDYVKCTRTITCPEPHMLVKWLDSDLCDLHAPSTVDGTNQFTYTCNGTHWTMHGFPIASVICGSAT